MTKRTVKPVPEGYHTVAPYLVVRGASDLVDFLKEVFKAKENLRFTSADGMIINHAEVSIGDSIMMLADATAEHPPFPAMIHLYLEDTDDAYRRALKAGAVSLREPTDQIFGDRSSGIKDRWGNHWWIATHTEDMSPEEMKKKIEVARTRNQ